MIENRYIDRMDMYYIGKRLEERRTAHLDLKEAGKSVLQSS